MSGSKQKISRTFSLLDIYHNFLKWCKIDEFQDIIFKDLYEHGINTYIKPDTPINVYAQFCLNTAKSKFSLVHPEGTSSGSDNCNFSKVSDFNGGL